jgi:hypothetical protein
MHQFTILEDCIELTLPIDIDLIDLSSLNWHRYNPRKNVERYGCSITSLDGSDTGVPDLDSVLEYNQLNSTNYKEKDFNVPTKHSRPFEKMLNLLGSGRSHYLHLPPGGFFPWHRDSDSSTFRLIFTISGCTSDSLVWAEDDKLLQFQNLKWYYINTRKKHSLFAFEDAYFAVFNVVYNYNTYSILQNYFLIK